MEETYTVGELSAAVARIVARAFPDDVWVEGEIRDLSRSRNGHVYFTLIDLGGADDPAPSLPITLFAPDREAVNRVLVRTGAMRMTDGVHVRIRGRINHYAARGTVQLRMTWIDTDYTLGKLAAERRALLQKLETAGDLRRNASIALPLVPLRIGLITSVGSAAQADFVTELEHSGYGFHVLIVDARVQGASAPPSVAGALRAIEAHVPDIVAVVRGGGAQTDLAAFDAEVVAIAIAHAPFPVFTGIGHEVDTTVADHVAAHGYKTPTACAQAVVALVREVDEQIAGQHRALSTRAVAGTMRAQRRLDHFERQMAATARLQIARHNQELDSAQLQITDETRRAAKRAQRTVDRSADRVRGAAQAAIVSNDRAVAERTRRLQYAAPRSLEAQQQRLNGKEAVRRAQEPARLLARGWSVTYGADGALVRGPGDVALGDALRTKTVGGEIRSVVDGTSSQEAE